MKHTRKHRTATFRLALLIFALAMVASCDQQASVKTTRPLGEVKRTTITEKLDDKGKPTERTTTELSGKAEGTSAEASGSEAAQASTVQPATASLTDEGVTASGGGGSNKATAKGETSTFANPMLYAGILLILAGLACTYWTTKKTGGLLVSLIGVGLIMLLIWPILMCWGVAIGAVLMAARILFGDVAFERVQGALGAVVKGVAAMPAEAQAQARLKIKEHAKPKERAAIDREKIKAGLLA